MSRLGTALVLCALLATAGCSDRATTPVAGPIVSWLGPAELARAGAEPVALDDPLPTSPLLAVDRGADVLAMRADGLDAVGLDGVRTPVLDWETPVLGGEVVHGATGTAVSGVTTELGELDEHTRVLWVDEASGDVTTLLDTPGNVPLVGVLPDGVVVRDQLGRSTLGIVGWDGALVGLGIDATDAVLVPETTLLVVQDDEDGPLRVLDVATGQQVAVEGMPEAAALVQAATPPTGARVALALREAGDDGSGLWVLRGDPVEARRLGDLGAADVVAGFSDDGRWVVVLREGTRPEAVATDGSGREETTLPDVATPLGWSRTALTLQSMRPPS